MEEKKNKILTVPNALSLLRILLVPVFMYLYIGRQNTLWTAIVLIISCASDVIDGPIARKYNQVSDVGKALDPIGDKLTQIGLMVCLITKYPLMWVPTIIIVVKEIVSGILGLVTIKKANVVKGAVWHGKLTTVLLFLMMGLHLLWPPRLPDLISWISIGICCAMMLYSFTMYTIRYIRTLKEAQTKEETSDGE
ncbi:MAG: CDP-alcohol phosphatidyltransferase family protein [Lachnospiraceae bacterium]|nr:CDP-alcohol phosphatidyltransferase family protein [Lachnospiraceae bacterium]